VNRGDVAEVTGIRDTLRVLRSVDKVAFFTAQAKIKGATKEFIDVIDGTIPQAPPTRGFDHNGRTGWVNRKKPFAIYGGRRSSKHRDRQEWPLVRISVASAPVEIADMAGRGKADGPKIPSLLEALGPWGNPSRFVWRNSERVRREAQATVLAAMKAVMREENQRLTVYKPGV
jgi:hypothetical protein